MGTLKTNERLQTLYPGALMKTCFRTERVCTEYGMLCTSCILFVDFLCLLNFTNG